MIMSPATTDTFSRHESAVRSYCRSFPAVFATARGSEMFDEDGQRWIDFFAGAGALNYGHNPPFIKQRLIRYLEQDGIAHGLDMHTVAKREFIDAFVEIVLKPRHLDYRLQFCGPTGANAVEAALKLARNVTGRTNIIAFTGAWHGMTSGCLSVTSRRDHRQSAGFPLANVTMVPFPDGPRPFPGAIEFIENALSDSHSGVDEPAAFILETVQAEGGVYVAPDEFLRQLRALCERRGILLIVDDIQAGCGRTGSFFSFDEAGIVPDIVCLSKSIGGYGMPMSLLLVNRQIDLWKPGEHSGTFRGNQLAFIAAAAALDEWKTGAFAEEIAKKGAFIRESLRRGLADLPNVPAIRGKGMLIGVDLIHAGGRDAAQRVIGHSFRHGLIVESCGREGAVIKIIPPLTIGMDLLQQGLDILIQAIRASV
jgi:diaminobutyrate-2-oxoglutarate transaminase